MAGIKDRGGTMLQDRGNIKWQGMMLTEHAQAVKGWLESDGLVERPTLDDWELQSLQEEIEIAYKRQCEARVTIWRKGKALLYIGKITELDYRLNCISIEGPFGGHIPVVDVVKVQCMY